MDALEEVFREGEYAIYRVEQGELAAVAVGRWRERRRARIFALSPIDALTQLRNYGGDAGLTSALVGAAMIRFATYIAFDGDADLMSYRTIQGWSADPTVPFFLRDAHELTNARDDSLPESIIKQLKPRLDASENLLLLISDKTAYNRRGILAYELRYAFMNQIPILLAFIGQDGDRPLTNRLWHQSLFPRLPAMIRNQPAKFCVVLPFTQRHVVSAIRRFNHISRPNQGFTLWW